MSLAQDIDVLRRVPLFAGLADEPLRLLAFSGERVSLVDGAPALAAGVAPDGAHVVLSGFVRVTDPLRRRRPEDDGARLVPGSIVNEAALVAEIEHPLTIRADGPCELLHLRRAVFRRLLTEFPDVAMRLHAEMTARFVAFADDLARIGARLDE